MKKSPSLKLNIFADTKDLESKVKELAEAVEIVNKLKKEINEIEIDICIGKAEA